MPSSYGADPKDLKPVKLDEATLVAIGRLIRAFAEFEELATLTIGAHAKINQSQSVIVLGKAGLATRLKMAEHLAKLAGSDHLDRFKAVFDTVGFRDLHQCRNAVAHGVLLGVDDDGMLAFLTDKTDEPQGSSTTQLVASYHPETIQKLSVVAEGAIEPSAKMLGLQSWLKRYQPQSLHPHKKGRKPRNRGDKPRPPPAP